MEVSRYRILVGISHQNGQLANDPDYSIMNFQKLIHALENDGNVPFA